MVESRKKGIDMRKYPTLNPLFEKYGWGVHNQLIPRNKIEWVKNVRARTGCGLWDAVQLAKIIQFIGTGELEVTQEVMEGVTDPKLKQILVEAICLRTVNK